MAIAIGRPDRYTALEDSSVDSIRYMWWKQYVFPMIYFSNRDFTGIGLPPLSSPQPNLDMIMRRCGGQTPAMSV